MKRNLSIDVIKFVAIFLVCFYHFEWISTDGLQIAEFGIYDLFKQWILVFSGMAVPLFFMVNGYLVLDKEFNFDKTFKNILNILAKYYFFLFVTLSVAIGVYKLNFADIFNLSNIVNMLLFYRPSGMSLNYLWFIPCFIAITLISPAFTSLFSIWDKNSKKYIIFLIAISIMFIFLPKYLYPLSIMFTKLKAIDTSSLLLAYPFSSQVGTFIVYFLIGGVLKKLKNYPPIKNHYLILIFILATFINWGAWFIISTSTQSSFDIVFQSYSMVPTIFMTISFFILVQNIFKKVEISENFKNVIVFVSKNTLNIYFLHRIIDIALFSRLRLIIPYRGILANSIKTVVMLLLSSIIILILKRFKITRWMMK